jgi:hypothetical protein
VKGTRRKKEQPFVQEMDVRVTGMGLATYIKVRTESYRQLSWSEVWTVFAAAYPNRWAVQFFPPESELVDDVHCYHLWVLDDPPLGVNINRRS